jgi:uncharacterized protein (DUF433 family)
MNWLDCPLVESFAGKLSGAPVIVQSRVRPEDLIVNRDEGPEWLAENYGLPIGTVRAILAFYYGQKVPADHPA